MVADTHLTTLLPEWAEQEAVILAWPNEKTDWAPWIDDVHATYVELVNAINDTGAVVVLLCREQDIGLIKSKIPYAAQVVCVPAEFNDTWVRDYAFLTCETPLGNVPVEFSFNGWGEKFSAGNDNLVNQRVLAKLCQHKLVTYSAVVEGGAIEMDENQHLLSTQSCLFNRRRNGKFTADEYNQLFESALGAKEITLFEHGHLDGDDTDGHIDTLLRFTPLHGVVLQSAYNRPTDSHFAGLNWLKMETQAHLPTHQLFELPLPFVSNEDGTRLPASYANFLICNRSVIMPVYGVQEDKEAVEVMEKAFPNHRIVPINCFSLVQQFGSLHCITMQVPADTLKAELIAFAKTGVNELT